MGDVANARQNYRQWRHNASDGNNGETEFNKMTDYVIGWQKDATDTSATNVTTNKALVGGRVPYTCRVISAHWVQQAISTAHATNYATLTLNKNDGANSTMIAVGTVNTQSASIAAYTSKALTLTASAVQVASGGVLFFNIGKTNTGRKLHPGSLTVVLRRV